MSAQSHDFHCLEHSQKKGYIRRADDARSKPSLSWAMFCLSFCSDARRVMLIWKRQETFTPTGSKRNLTTSENVCGQFHFSGECNGLPLQGSPLFSAACCVHECFLLFPETSDKWLHNSATYRAKNGIKMSRKALMTRDKTAATDTKLQSNTERPMFGYLVNVLMNKTEARQQLYYLFTNAEQPIKI